MEEEREVRDIKLIDLETGEVVMSLSSGIAKIDKLSHCSNDVKWPIESTSNY